MIFVSNNFYLQIPEIFKAIREASKGIPSKPLNSGQSSEEAGTDQSPQSGDAETHEHEQLDAGNSLFEVFCPLDFHVLYTVCLLNFKIKKKKIINKSYIKHTQVVQCNMRCDHLERFLHH